MAATTKDTNIPTDDEALKDPWLGEMPPHNTPYWVIFKYRGNSFLRGWIQVDKQTDPRGYRRKMGHLEKVAKDQSHIWH